MNFADKESGMTSRRQLAAAATLALVGALVLGPRGVRAQEKVPPPKQSHPGYFDPQGKAPSKFTTEILRQQSATLPFADKRDFEEQRKGFIAPMKDPKIMADAGHVAWDMERFQWSAPIAR